MNEILEDIINLVLVEPTFTSSQNEIVDDDLIDNNLETIHKNVFVKEHIAVVSNNSKTQKKPFSGFKKTTSISNNK